MSEAWIVDVVRTPRGRGRPDGGLHGIHPQELLAQCLRALSVRTGFDPVEVDDVVAGNGILAGDHGDDIARLALLLAGWPETVPGMTLNRFCGSGQQAITIAAMGVGSGAQDLVVAGGVESMSRWNVTAGSVTIDGANPALRERYPTVPQGISADLIASVEGFTREDVDAFAVESQRRAAAAMSEGHFDRTVIAVADATGDVVLRHDEHPRPTLRWTVWRSCVPRSPRLARATRTAKPAATTRSALPDTRASTTSSTYTMRATRPAWSTARRPR